MPLKKVIAFGCFAGFYRHFSYYFFPLFSVSCFFSLSFSPLCSPLFSPLLLYLECSGMARGGESPNAFPLISGPKTAREKKREELLSLCSSKI